MKVRSERRRWPSVTSPSLRPHPMRRSGHSRHRPASVRCRPARSVPTPVHTCLPVIRARLPEIRVNYVLPPSRRSHRSSAALSLEAPNRCSGRARHRAGHCRTGLSQSRGGMSDCRTATCSVRRVCSRIRSRPMPQPRLHLSRLQRMCRRRGSRQRRRIKACQGCRSTVRRRPTPDRCGRKLRHR